jgi:hypothetical protein
MSALSKTPSAPSATSTATCSQVCMTPADDADGADANATPNDGRADGRHTPMPRPSVAGTGWPT